MPGKAIFRISKLKSFGAFAGAEHHNNRSRETKNADGDRTGENFVFLGEAEGELATLAKERIGHQTIRKNAVLGIDVFMSASPEYFRPDDPGRVGYWERDRLEAWVEASTDFLKQEFGESRILRAECHLDESTPHIHAVVIPLTDKGKLSYRQLYGGKRSELSELQDRSWSAVSHLGLERGLKGSQAEHREIKDWYAEMQRPLSPDLDLETVRVQVVAQAAERPRFEPPMPVPEQWASVRAYYLSQQLPGGLIDVLHEQGVLYTDFVMRTPKGLAQTIVLNDEGVEWLAVLARDWPGALVSGELVVDAPELLRLAAVGPDQLATIDLSGSTVKLKYRAISQVVQDLREQYMTGSLVVKSVNSPRIAL